MCVACGAIGFDTAELAALFGAMGAERDAAEASPGAEEELPSLAGREW